MKLSPEAMSPLEKITRAAILAIRELANKNLTGPEYAALWDVFSEYRIAHNVSFDDMIEFGGIITEPADWPKVLGKVAP